MVKSPEAVPELARPGAASGTAALERGPRTERIPASTPATSLESALRLGAHELRLEPKIPSLRGSIDGIAGQERAREAITFGLGIDAQGYNIAVGGPANSGRNTLVGELAADYAASLPAPPDWIYVHNFENPRHPVILPVPAGIGDDLADAMDELIGLCRSQLPAAFTGDAYEQRVQHELTSIGSRREALLGELDASTRRLGFAINPTPMGIGTIPLDGAGHPLSDEAFAQLTPAERESINTRAERAQEIAVETMRALRRLDVEARSIIREVDAQVALSVIAPALDELRANFAEPALGKHVDAVQADILGNLDAFKRLALGNQVPPMPFGQSLEDEVETLLRKYHVNLFVTHGRERQEGAPVVSERNPTVAKLFGRIEFENRFGALVTDFTRIRAGALHMANGGVLVLQAADLLGDPRLWPRLKHALKTGELRTEEDIESLGLPVAGLTPMPTPLKLKLILVGSPLLFAILEAVDTDFGELFKIRAEFEPDVPADEQNIATYAAFVRREAERGGGPEFEQSALVELVRYGSWLADRQDRLSTRLGLVGDLCTEAAQIARSGGDTVVTAAHVLGAMRARTRRSATVPDRIRKLIAEGTLHIQTSGAVVGQVNGLAVIETGEQSFGIPMRITCRTGGGQSGVVAIERETERSGSIHTKGVLVLTGYLMGTFGADLPLAFNASLTFEQSYDEVEGDSASSAELYAILTSLADLPVRQDIAVTGSVDQFGNVQAVGGVTAKVEGFFDVCQEVGLTGGQGVIVPRANVRNLVLREEVVRAVEDGRFHIWAVDRVEQGIELLTGRPACSDPPADDDLFARVANRLATLREAAAPEPSVPSAPHTR